MEKIGKRFVIYINCEQLYAIHSRFSKDEWRQIYETGAKELILLNRALNVLNEIPESLNDSYCELIRSFSQTMKNEDFTKIFYLKDPLTKLSCLGNENSDFLTVYMYFGDVGSSFVDITKQALYILDI